MPNNATTAKTGYRCSIQGCPKKHNRLFGPLGLAMHVLDVHGVKEFMYRLGGKYVDRK